MKVGLGNDLKGVDPSVQGSGCKTPWGHIIWASENDLIKQAHHRTCSARRRSPTPDCVRGRAPPTDLPASCNKELHISHLISIQISRPHAIRNFIYPIWPLVSGYWSSAASAIRRPRCCSHWGVDAIQCSHTSVAGGGLVARETGKWSSLSLE